jgi:hypothetical protein
VIFAMLFDELRFFAAGVHREAWSKHGNQRCNPFVHIGWPDDHFRGVLGPLVVHPTGGWSEVVTA